MMEILLWAFALSGAYYAFFILSTRRGLGLAATTRPRTEVQPTVSILVAMRNEERNLPRLAARLVGQEYPREAMEIVLIDDASDDGTLRIARLLAEKESRIRVVASTSHANRPATSVTSGKALALAEGIELSRGEILLMTDADCEPPLTWVSAMVSMFTEDVAYVVGPVVERAPGMFGKYRGLDFFGVLAAAAGRIGLQKPVNSYGANVAFRRSAYDRAGGFQADRRMGDEEFLMHVIHERNWGRVLFCAEPKAKVVTHVSNSVEEFWRQRLRWGSMKERYPSAAILVELGVVFLFFALLSGFLFASIFDRVFFPGAAAGFALKFTVDFFSLRSASRILQEDVPWGAFIVSELLHAPYIVCVTVVAQLSSIEWRGRRVSG